MAKLIRTFHSIKALDLVVGFLGISKLRNFELSIATVVFGKIASMMLEKVTRFLCIIC